MTPAELLEEAKNKFIVLYHNDAPTLEKLLRQALGKYQDKAGPIGTVKVNRDHEGVIETPSDLLEIAVAIDRDMRYHESAINGNNIEIEVSEDETSFPITVHYFYNLRNWGLDIPLPVGTTSLLLDYLTALIDIPNTERERNIAASTEQQVELPSRQELEDRVLQIEQAMEEAKSIGIPVAVW